jgi:hypothetical protein
MPGGALCYAEVATDEAYANAAVTGRTSGPERGVRAQSAQVAAALLPELSWLHALLTCGMPGNSAITLQVVSALRRGCRMLSGAHGRVAATTPRGGNTAVACRGWVGTTQLHNTAESNTGGAVTGPPSWRRTSGVPGHLFRTRACAACRHAVTYATLDAGLAAKREDSR